MIDLKYQYLEGYIPIFCQICLNNIHYCIKYIIRPHVYPICCQRRYINEPEKLIHHGESRVCNIYLEKPNFN